MTHQSEVLFLDGAERSGADSKGMAAWRQQLCGSIHKELGWSDISLACSGIL